MSKSFDGKVALVTGGGSGIGRAAAQTFAREGASVVVADVALDLGEETVRLINQTGGVAEFTRVDVTKADEVKAMVQSVEQSFGKLDFAVNNAGIDGLRAATSEYPESTWFEVLNVNLTGVFLCMKYELPLLVRQGGGAIVNVSSVAGVTGFPGHSAYTASKHGVIGLTKTAALEYAKAGIRVNAICPCYTRTPMLERMLKVKPELEAKLERRVPLGRLGTAEEVAAAALYLCGATGSFITGHALVLDGGIMAE